MKTLGFTVAVLALALPGTARGDVKADVVSTGGRINVKKIQRPEGTTVVLFVTAASVMERQFVDEVQKLLPSDARVSLAVVHLKDTQAPAAQQLSVTSTPTAITFDRFGKEIGRSSQPEEIRAAVRKGQLLARIKWIDEDDPKAPEAYGAPASSLKRGLPGIVKTMALRPDAFRMFNIMSQIHFSKGFLERREHEMIAAYVSALNKCKF